MIATLEKLKDDLSSGHNKLKDELEFTYRSHIERLLQMKSQILIEIQRQYYVRLTHINNLQILYKQRKLDQHINLKQLLSNTTNNQVNGLLSVIISTLQNYSESNHESPNMSNQLNISLRNILLASSNNNMLQNYVDSNSQTDYDYNPKKNTMLTTLIKPNVDNIHEAKPFRNYNSNIHNGLNGQDSIRHYKIIQPQSILQNNINPTLPCLEAPNMNEDITNRNIKKDINVFNVQQQTIQQTNIIHPSIPPSLYSISPVNHKHNIDSNPNSNSNSNANNYITGNKKRLTNDISFVMEVAWSSAHRYSQYCPFCVRDGTIKLKNDFWNNITQNMPSKDKKLLSYNEREKYKRICSVKLEETEERIKKSVVFKSQKEYRDHYNLYHKTNGYKCIYRGCEKESTSWYNYVAHLTHHDKDAGRPFYCTYNQCNKSSSTKHNLIKHIQGVHKWKISEKSTTRKIVQVDNKKNDNNINNKIINNTNNIMLHYNATSKVTPPTLQKQANNGSNNNILRQMLNRNKLKNKNKNKNKNTGLGRRSNHNKHSQTLHHSQSKLRIPKINNNGIGVQKKKTIGIAQNNYSECRICHRKFTTQIALQIHFKTHISSNPFECKYCKKRFTTQIALQNHCKVIHKL